MEKFEEMSINPEEAIPRINELINNSLLNIKEISFIFNEDNLNILLDIFNILGQSDIKTKDILLDTLEDFEETPERNEQTIKILKLINDDLFEMIILLKYISEVTGNDFSNFINDIGEFVKELSTTIIQYKYQETYQEAHNRLEYARHYEELIENDINLKNLYNDLNNYYRKTLDEKKLNEKDIILKKEHYFHDDTPDPTNHDDEDSFHIVFQINKNCNFKCTYCYEGLDKVTEILSIDDVEDIVKGIKNFARTLEEKGLVSKMSFSILGGEPTLVPQEVTHKLTKLLEDELDLKYIILITNNYSAKRTIGFFHPDFPRDKIKVQISYDGGRIQDDYRKDSKKNGTKESLTKEIRALLNEDNGIKVSLKATLPLEAISSVPDAVQDYVTFEEDINKKNNNPNNFSYYPTFDTTSILMYNLRQQEKCGNTKPKEKLFTELDETFKYLLKFEMDRLINNKPAFTRWFREMSYAANNTTCSAGSKLFGLDQDGIGRYCHRTEFGEEHTNVKFPYKKEQLNSLKYGDITSDTFQQKFFKTKEKLEKVINSDKEYSYCDGCKTLTCVKCPMVNITPDRSLDTSTTNDLYKDMYSHGLTLSCEINNQISKYLYIFDKIINNK